MKLTSETNPIRVDFLPKEAHRLPGKLGLTIAPGKAGPGLTGDWDRQLDEDLVRLRDFYRANVLVTLLEDLEMKRIGIPNLLERAARSGFETFWYPIPDVSVPDSIGHSAELVRAILDRLATRRVVVIHCLGGLGRSGTIAACCLVARGTEPDEAIEIVREARPGAVQNEAQETFVRRFAEAWNPAR
jgi:Cyclin-dependent kinase inhibitor 3 (CDKN3)